MPQSSARHHTTINHAHQSTVSLLVPHLLFIYLSEFNSEGSIPVTIPNPNLIPQIPTSKQSYHLNISKWGLDFNHEALRETHSIHRQVIAVMKCNQINLCQHIHHLHAIAILLVVRLFNFYSYHILSTKRSMIVSSHQDVHQFSRIFSSCLAEIMCPLI